MKYRVIKDMPAREVGTIVFVNNEGFVEACGGYCVNFLLKTGWIEEVEETVCSQCGKPTSVFDDDHYQVCQKEEKLADVIWDKTNLYSDVSEEVAQIAKDHILECFDKASSKGSIEAKLLIDDIRKAIKEC